MNQCKRVGLNVTRRCNWKCATCFYRWKPDFAINEDRTLASVMEEVVAAKKRGCEHALAVGWGEPALWSCVVDWVRECKKIGLSTSIITNGTGKLSTYESLYAAGIDHLHVSVHGTGAVLNEIAGVETAAARQSELVRWLGASDMPWRMNMTVQQANYRQLTEIAQYCVENGCRHVVSLGFLPLYEWNSADALRKVAVDPRLLRPEIERLSEVMERYERERGTIYTIRYHPMCHLDQKYWQYVVNAKHVFYDPWEWDYCHCGEDKETFERSACSMRDVVALRDPCLQCTLWEGCGGWNRAYAAGYNCIKRPITREMLYTPKGAISADAHETGPAYFFDQNPANHLKGWFE